MSHFGSLDPEGKRGRRSLFWFFKTKGLTVERSSCLQNVIDFFQFFCSLMVRSVIDLFTESLKHVFFFLVILLLRFWEGVSRLINFSHTPSTPESRKIFFLLSRKINFRCSIWYPADQVVSFYTFLCWSFSGRLQSCLTVLMKTDCNYTSLTSFYIWCPVALVVISLNDP